LKEKEVSMFHSNEQILGSVKISKNELETIVDQCTTDLNQFEQLCKKRFICNLQHMKHWSHFFTKKTILLTEKECHEVYNDLEWYAIPYWRGNFKFHNKIGNLKCLCQTSKDIVELTSIGCAIYQNAISEIPKMQRELQRLLCEESDWIFINKTKDAK
jgi:hypothetical protein